MKGTIAIILFIFSTTLAQRLDFKCPQPNGHFEHPEQCDRYFICKNYHVERKLCADGLVFDPDKVETFEADPCDTKYNTKHKCRGKPKLQKPKPGDGNCPRQKWSLRISRSLRL